MSEESEEKIADSNYQLGIISGLEQAYKILSDQASKKFANHSDEDARLLREYSDIFWKMSREKREKYDKEYPK